MLFNAVGLALGVTTLLLVVLIFILLLMQLRVNFLQVNVNNNQVKLSKNLNDRLIIVENLMKEQKRGG